MQGGSVPPGDISTPSQSCAHSAVERTRTSTSRRNLIYSQADHPYVQRRQSSRLSPRLPGDFGPLVAAFMQRPSSRGVVVEGLEPPSRLRVKEPRYQLRHTTAPDPRNGEARVNPCVPPPGFEPGSQGSKGLHAAATPGRIRTRHSRSENWGDPTIVRGVEPLPPFQRASPSDCCEPRVGVEPTTFALPWRRTTAVLSRHVASGVRSLCPRSP